MKYEYWLSCLNGIGCGAMRQLIKYAGSAKNVYEMPAKDLESIYRLSQPAAQAIALSRRHWDLDGEYEKLWEKNINFVFSDSEGFPDKLKNIVNPPRWLFYIGELPKDEVFSVAIVGARACSEYAAAAATELAKRVADYGANVISGMARGVDGYAHEGAMDHGGKTFAILGCGVDVVYPPEHMRMYERILESGGGVISEYPPGRSPLARQFPARNRIISGFSDAVIVVEGRERSGSLITADHALDQGKDVYVVPGLMGDIRAMGSNRLIKNGAGIIISPDDLAGDFGFIPKADRGGSDRLQIPLEKEELKVYSTLDLCPKDINELSKQTGLSQREAILAVYGLIDKGLAGECPGGYKITV